MACRKFLILDCPRLHPDAVWKGRGLLRTLASGQQASDEIVDIRLTRGSKGGECLVEVGHGVLQLRIRIDGSQKADVDVNVIASTMLTWGVDDFARAARALKVLKGALDGEEVELYLTDFDKAQGPIKFRWSAARAEVFDNLTLFLRAAVALKRLASAKGWNVEGCPMANLKKGDAESWMAADTFDLYGRVSLPAFPFTLHFRERPELELSDAAFGNLLLEHFLDVQVAGEVKFRLPAWVRLRGFRVVIETSTERDPWRLRCTPTEKATREYLAPTIQRPEL